MGKHTHSSISHEVFNDGVPGMHCVLRAEPLATIEGLVRDYQLQGKDKGLSFPRVVRGAFCINFKYT